MENKEICPLCGGKIGTGSTTFTVDFGSGVVVFRNVPANVCKQCGEAWIDDPIASSIEKAVEEAKGSQRELEVINLAA